MNELEKVATQMRQYVHTDDTGHECRVSGNTLMAWANTIEQVIRRQAAIANERIEMNTQ